MKTICLRTAIVVAVVGLGGCSGSNVSEVSELATGETLAAASINPAPTPGSILSPTTTGSNGAANEGAAEIETFRNPFAPPKDPPPPPVVEIPEPEPEPEPEPAPEVRPPGTPPKIRLVGFMNIGEPKVLVAYGDELETLAIGDTLEDMKVIQIESPDLTMLFEEREIKLSLFDQEWQHEGSPALAGNHSRPQSRPHSRNTTGSSANGAASSASTTAGAPVGEPSDIPGFGPNAGRPPGFQPPTSSGTGSTPGGSIGNPPPSLPGLNSEASDIGVSDLLRLDPNASGPPAGGFPAVPSGS